MSLETFEKLPQSKKERILTTGIRAFSRSAYQNVSTDSITKECRISKGILFHYFGSKKAFYLYCLETAMTRLTQKTETGSETDFYGILFSSMNRKLALCARFPDEMRLVNMASRDPSEEIAQPKADILQAYKQAIQAESLQTLEQALAFLSAKEVSPAAVKGLHLYINAILNQYLLQYQQTPDVFFENSTQIQAEMKAYLDLMLHGIKEAL